MQYGDEIKIHLGKTKFESFRSEFINKYGLQRLVRFITGHGTDSNGEDWILLNDVALEARPINELRVGPFDVSSWDLSNRREYRSLLLLWGWVGLNNTKPANFKFLYRKFGNTLFPYLRMHDLGNTFGSTTDLKKPKNFLSFMEFQKVNVFPNHFLTMHRDKNELSLHWNDLVLLGRYFENTTWADLKWMARKIAVLKKEDIQRTFEESGMPKPVVDLYTIKMVQRRNEIVEAFDLQDEYALYQTPELATYSPKLDHYPDAIKKGKLVRTFFAKKNNVYQAQEKWGTFLPRLLSFNLPISQWTDKKSGQTFSTSLQG